jgi:hypothetical protein
MASPEEREIWKDALVSELLTVEEFQKPDRVSHLLEKDGQRQIWNEYAQMLEEKGMNELLQTRDYLNEWVETVRFWAHLNDDEADASPLPDRMIRRLERLLTVQEARVEALAADNESDDSGEMPNDEINEQRREWGAQLDLLFVFLNQRIAILNAVLFYGKVYGDTGKWDDLEDTEKEQLERQLEIEKNERVVATKKITALQEKLEHQRRGRPDREQLKALMDMDGHRFESSGRVNRTALGNKLGVDSTTVERWIEKMGLSEYADGPHS